MDEPLEFGEGDIGLPGGVQIEEPAKLHPLHRETIMRRAVGSTARRSEGTPPETLEVVLCGFVWVGKELVSRGV